ncbi:MAG: hypothetical protein K6L80_10135 [Agarilytica sp.]
MYLISMCMFFSLFLSANVFSERMWSIAPKDPETEEFDPERLSKAKEKDLYCEVEFTVTKGGIQEI